jgi:F0F1-type ATP synthase beta subunit
MLFHIMLNSPTSYRALPTLSAADAAETWSIHREAPEFTEQSTEQEILATGIKVWLP